MSKPTTKVYACTNCNVIVKGATAGRTHMSDSDGHVLESRLIVGPLSYFVEEAPKSTYTTNGAEFIDAELQEYWGIEAIADRL